MNIWLLIFFATLATYATRAGGHVLLARIGSVSPRVNALLNAVPAAVLPTLVVPAFVDGNWPERAVLVLCAVLALRLSLLNTVLVGTAIVILARALGA